MINFRIIARIFSLVLIAEGLFMFLSAIVSLLYGEPAARLILSAIITLVTGILVFTPLRETERLFGNKEGYIIITGSWILAVLFGTLPYLFTGTASNFSDAFFESMSGFTTTGASVFSDVESLSKGILFWRSLTQWLGGAGFILISLSVLPVMKTVNIQLSLPEFSGQPSDKIHPKIKETAKRLIFIYTALTLSEVVVLSIAGMSFFDAFCHSLSTMSTGGFSTRNDGIASFGSPAILIVLMLFMFLAGTNMTIVYFALKKNFKKVLGNAEFLFYLLVCALFIAASTMALWLTDGLPIGESVMHGSFQVISIISTTGYYSTDYSLWSPVLLLLLFVLMFTGGSSGSASSSLKVVRLLLLTKNARHEMRRMIHPNAVIPVRIDGKAVPMGFVNNLLVYVALYFIITSAGAFVISLMDYDLITSLSTSAALVGNIGHGMGSFGPLADYGSIPEWTKWFFSFLMLLGRLELISVLILFTSGFYRR